jgi:hypothetical protein
VSITEDATMSRTRSEGGATVVREEAITKIAGEGPACRFLGARFFLLSLSALG